MTSPPPMPPDLPDWGPEDEDVVEAGWKQIAEVAGIFIAAMAGLFAALRLLMWVVP